MFQKLEGVPQSQIPVNLAGCAALVERVKVDAVHSGVQQFRTLAGSELDSHFLNGIRIAPGAFQGLEQSAGKQVPPDNSAMRFMPDRLVTGMMPARTGTLIPASRQRSR